MEESVGIEGLKFKWGKKKAVGGKNKDVQFYESFTYDGDEYRLYDFVLVTGATEPDSSEPFIAMIIKIWDHKKSPKRVKLLWFFKPCEISPYLEGVPDVLGNELFLASGEGPGVANVNNLEAIGGKCSVVCISKDERNPQPSDEFINSADFVFRRAFDVGSCKVVDTIANQIAGIDVKFIFNRASCQKEGTAVQKIEAAINGNSDSLKLNGHLANGSVRKIVDNSCESSDSKESGSGHEQEKEKGHSLLATKRSTLVEERSNKDSGSRGNHCNDKTEENDVRQQITKQRSMPAEESSSGREQEKEKGHSLLATKRSTLVEERSNKDSGSRGNHCNDKAEENDVRKQITKQRSLPAEERCSNFEASGSRIVHSTSNKATLNDVQKQLSKQKSMPTERHSEELNGLDDRPLKKQKLDGSVTVRDGQNRSIFQNMTSDDKNDTGPSKRPRDKVLTEEVPPEKPSFVKKRDLGVSVSEGENTKTVTNKGLSKKPSFERIENKKLADDNGRNYQVIEVTRRPDAGNIKWFRNPSWEESLMEAEKKGSVVLLQNLDPTYTSAEVEDIVYSALNEQCEARMIECTSVTVPRIGQALVIFKTREVAQSVIRRLEKGCLLLSNGRTLVASFAKITPPGKPSSFSGHIKLHKTQIRREMRDAVATSHCAQQNNLEFDLAMEWCLHQARHEQASETVSKRQWDDIKKLRISFKPKLP